MDSRKTVTKKYIMPVIQLMTTIKAPITTCFDLARSIDLHLQSMEHTKEKAVAGITSGLIGLGETVTWKARHFGIPFQLTSQITAFERPLYFVDEMIQGPFKRLRHVHRFEEQDGYTVMMDMFDFAVPMGVLGKLVDKLFLTRYLTILLQRRNQVIKEKAQQ